MHGRVTGVSRNPLGDELTTDAALGATTIYVDDGTDFDEDGASVLINGTVYPYSSMEYVGDSADEGDPAVLYLSTGLVAAAAEGDRVDVWDDALGEVAVEYVATIVPDSAVPGDPLEAEVDHRLVPLLAEGIRAKGSESVELARDGDDLVLKTILGKTAEIIGTIVTGGLIRTDLQDTVGLKLSTELGLRAYDGTGAVGLSISNIGGLTAYTVTYFYDDVRLVGGAALEVNGPLSVTGGYGAQFQHNVEVNGSLTVDGEVDFNDLAGTGGTSYVMVGNGGVLSRGGSASDLNARLNAIEARLDALEAP